MTAILSLRSRVGSKLVKSAFVRNWFGQHRHLYAAVGANIFVAQAVFKQPLSIIYPGAILFTVISIIALLVITYVPELSLLLTRLHD